MSILLSANTNASERGNWLQMTEEVKGINLVICLYLCQIEAKKDYIETISSSLPTHLLVQGSFQLCLLWHLNKTCWFYEEKLCSSAQSWSSSPLHFRQESGNLALVVWTALRRNVLSLHWWRIGHRYISWPKRQAECPGKAVWMLPRKSCLD